ncbi:MAG: 2-amino-4-hydroxy-6-hydroxymethyldihydropteridine diphosphokinase [Phycisphaerae bacterium]|jgi:2-amino-4-hydroxy-6-hydroxymethyldihydropteridine diphosphokinase
MTISVTAYIGLGTNLGDRVQNIAQAKQALSGLKKTTLISASTEIETEPLGHTNQPKFLNAVAQINTELSPEELLAKLLEIETSLGRERKQKWASRTIDLDLLLYGDGIIESENLTVPHKQMHLRSFVLKGLCELDRQLIHPLLGVTVAELAARLNGCDYTLDAARPQYITIAGLIGVGKTTLATKLCGHLDADLLLEPYDTNPFLPKVYAGRQELALHCQLYFLLNRVEQLNPANFPLGRMLISDYVFEKDMIYAKRSLSSEQFAVYDSLYPDCAANVIKPILVIYMRDTAEHCLDRIHYRNRPYEQKLDTYFLSMLDADYEELFASWTNCPVIRLSTSEFDCTRPADMDYIISQISAYTTFKTAEQ